MRLLGLVGFMLLLGTTGCGGETSPVGGSYSAGLLRLCLTQAGVSVFDANPEYVVGDTSRGTFQVVVDGNFATVAIAASEAQAAKTERLAQAEYESYGGSGDVAHHRGNVAYWQLDESDAPVRAVDKCL